MNTLKSVRLFSSIAIAAGMLLAGLSAQANPGKPDFGAALFGDGKTWGTKGTTSLPAPNEHNLGSYDGLYIIIDGMGELLQLPVAEAAPGNPMYNGGRWISYGVTFLVAPYLITSYADLMTAAAAGDVMITQGHPLGGPDYFQCPLLPDKSS